jgi:hypothetical protein
MAIEIDDPEDRSGIRVTELTGEIDWERAWNSAAREKLQRIREEAALRAAPAYQTGGTRRHESLRRGRALLDVATFDKLRMRAGHGGETS